MAIELSVAALYMMAFWLFVAVAIRMAMTGRILWLKASITMAALMLIMSTVTPLTLADSVVGLILFCMIGAVIWFVTWKSNRVGGG